MPTDDSLIPRATQLYVVRVWFEPDRGQYAWRASLRADQEPRRYFASPEALVAFLCAPLPPPK